MKKNKWIEYTDRRVQVEKWKSAKWNRRGEKVKKSSS
jgi:hypothetical protein